MLRQRSMYVSESYRVRMLAGLSAILAGSFYGFLHSLQENSGIPYRNGSGMRPRNICLLNTAFTFNVM
jgi:hypothetical protein